MARRFLVPIDLNKLEIQNVALQNLTSDPSTPALGQIYYNSTAGRIKLKNASAFVEIPTSGSIVNADINASAAIAYSKLNLNGSVTNADLAGSIALSKLATDPLARANHTGTQLASTISNFDTQVRTSRLDQLAAPTAAVSLNSQKITNLADPTSATDAATKNYVDNAVVGIDWKPSVRAIALSNITLSGTQTIDGVSLIAGDRVLVGGQTTGSQDGIYVVAAGGWARSSDCANGSVQNAFAVFVEEGTLYADTGWVLTNNGTVTIGTTDLVFVQFSSAGDITAGAGLTKTGSELNVGTASTARIVVNADNIDLATVTRTNTTDQVSGTFVQSLTTDTYGRVTAATTGTHTVATSATNGIARFNTASFTVTSGDVTIKTGGVTNTQLVNSGVTVTAGTGLSGGGAVSLGGTVTLNVSGITSVVAGTGVSVSNAGIGASTISIGQSVATSASPSFVDVTFTGSKTANTVLAAPNGSNGAPSFRVLAAADIPAAVQAKRYAVSIGNASATEFVITHSLGTQDVVISVYDNATYQDVECDIKRGDAAGANLTTMATIGFATAPSSNAYRVVVLA
jgi:hypothetical protein